MTRIDFHVNVEHRVHYGCRVTRKARTAGKRVVVYTRDPGRLAQFDAALWTFSALDFLPHVYSDSALAQVTPVLLALDLEQLPPSDVLLSLDDEVPPQVTSVCARFERVIEIVSRDEADRALARSRFKAYRELGLAPSHFESSSGE